MQHISKHLYGIQHHLEVIHSKRQSGITHFGEINMAEQPKEQVLAVTNMQRQWLHKAVTLQRENLNRSIAKELQGSEIYALRKREIEELNQLLTKLT